MPELLPCPFCGVLPSYYLDQPELYHSRCERPCPMFDEIFTLDAWNRRTPDLTAALARLKALEEEVHGKRNVWCEGGWAASDAECRKWADEIAAIRGRLGVGE